MGKNIIKKKYKKFRILVREISRLTSIVLTQYSTSNRNNSKKGGQLSMKGSITYEKNRKAYCVWWYVPEKKRSIPIRYYYGFKLYDMEMADKLLRLIQGTHEKSLRGECVFRIQAFTKRHGMDIIELFESWLLTKGKNKPGGVATYQSHFKTWIKPFFLDHKYALHEINLDVLSRLKTHIENAEKEPKTVKNVLDTMKTFLKYAKRSDFITTVPSFPLKSEYGLGDKYIPTIPRVVQFEIVNLIPEIHQPIFYWLILHPGRRPGEAMAIYKDDYNIFKNSFVIRRGISKRQVVMGPKNMRCHQAACHDEFKPFLEKLMKTEGPHLFVNPRARRKDKRYCDGTLNRLWNDACEKYGIKIQLYNGTKHSTLDYYYNDLKVSLTDLMDITGHKDLDCIKKYARMNVERQKSILDLEKNAPHLRLVHGPDQADDHKIVTSAKNGTNNK